MGSTLKNASIIIPLYNSQQYIGHVLNFLTKYHKKYNCEIIVVNDGSTDGSKSEALKYKDMIKLVDLETNLGRSSARNKGISEATGEILIFLDADCFPKDEDFFRLHLFFHENYIGALNGQVILSPDVNASQNRYIFFRHSEPKSRGLHKVSADHFATGNVSVKKDAILTAGCFDETIYLFEDVDMGLRLETPDFNIYRDDNILVHHLDTEISLERDMKRNYFAYSNSVKKILSKNPDFINKLPLVKIFEDLKRDSLFNIKNRHIFKLVYRYYQLFGTKVLPKKADKMFNVLIVAAAYNGYFGYNNDFFNSLS